VLIRYYACRWNEYWAMLRITELTAGRKAASDTSDGDEPREAREMRPVHRTRP